MKYKLIVALFLSLSCAWLTTENIQGAPEPDDHYSNLAPRFRPLVSQGATALQAKEYDLAISRFTAALQLNPDKNTACGLYNLRAKAYLYQKRWDQALQDANAAIRLNPRFYDPYIARAIVYRSRGNVDKAIAEDDTAIQLNPKAVRAYNNRGVAEGKRGRPERAIADYDRALRVDPNYADAYMNRAIAYEEMGDRARAMADFDQAIRLNPKVDYGYYNRGRLHFARGHFDKAFLDITEAIRQGGDALADAYLIRAKVYSELGNLAGAAADYERAIQSAQKDAGGSRTRGEAFFAKGHYAAAASNYANAKQMAPNDEVVLGSVAWFKATCPDASFRNGKAAVQESLKACEITKWKYWYHLDTLAAAYAELGNFDNAIKYQMQALNSKGLPDWSRKDMQEHLRFFQQRKPWRVEPKLPKG